MSGKKACEVVVRDARAGRDRSRDTAEGGEVLMTYRTDSPPNEGEHLTLPDGVEVEVIGIGETWDASGAWVCIAYVGNIWST